MVFRRRGMSTRPAYTRGWGFQPQTVRTVVVLGQLRSAVHQKALVIRKKLL